MASISLSLWSRLSKAVHAEAVVHYTRLARFYAGRSLDNSVNRKSADGHVFAVLWLGNAQEALERADGHAAAIEGGDVDTSLRVAKARKAVELAEEGVSHAAQSGLSNASAL
jgi:hypothetical protein